MKKTQRGFLVYSEFVDTLGASVRIRKSSSACYERCWIYIEGGGANGQVTAATHLSKQQAKYIIKGLQKFIDGK